MWPFKRKTLEDVLNPTKKIKIAGIIFTIRKINPLDYFNGSKSVVQFYDTYKHVEPGDPGFHQNLTKMKEHFSDVILAGVIEPKLARKKEDQGIYIENMFTDWSLAGDLYSAIMEYTYGKKKLISSASAAKS